LKVTARPGVTRAPGKEMIVQRRMLITVALVLVALMVAAAIGTYAYRAGVARGLEDSGKLAAPGTAVPYPYYYGPFWHPWPFFGFGFLFPLLFLFLLFGVLRRAFWGGRWRGACGAGASGVPPRFEEWHRRAHETMPEPGGQKV
jgi:hypothetical protein